MSKTSLITLLALLATVSAKPYYFLNNYGAPYATSRAAYNVADAYSPTVVTSLPYWSGYSDYSVAVPAAGLFDAYGLKELAAAPLTAAPLAAAPLAAAPLAAAPFNPVPSLAAITAPGYGIPYNGYNVVQY